MIKIFVRYLRRVEQYKQVQKYLIMDSLCYKLIKTQCCYANGLVLKIHVSFSALDELYIE